MTISRPPSSRKRRRHKATRQPVATLALSCKIGNGPWAQRDLRGEIARSLPKGCFAIAFLPRFERATGCDGANEFALWQKHHPGARCALQEGKEENTHGFEVWTIDYADTTALIDLGARKWIKDRNLSHGYSLPRLGSGAGETKQRSIGKTKPQAASKASDTQEQSHKLARDKTPAPDYRYMAESENGGLI